MNEFHDTVMFKKETAEDQARFFLHPEAYLCLSRRGPLTSDQL